MWTRYVDKVCGQGIHVRHSLNLNGEYISVLTCYILITLCEQGARFDTYSLPYSTPQLNADNNNFNHSSLKI